jgi:hypothetical protein
MIRAVVIALLCTLTTAYAGSDAATLIGAVKSKMDKVTTYKAVVGITVDVPFMKVPPAEATLYYKAPDKTAFQAKGFAMLPKQGADVTAVRLLQRPHVAIDAGTGTFQNATLRKVKVLPSDEASDVVVATLWIHESTLQIRKVESTMKKGGTVVAELTYGNETSARYGMPSFVKLMLDVGSFEIPKTMTGDFDAPKRDKSKGPQQAVVQLTYKSVEFNKSVSDDVFR